MFTILIIYNKETVSKSKSFENGKIPYSTLCFL